MSRAIVVATDFSPLSEEAFPYALHLSRALELPIRLVHAVEAVAPGEPHGELAENVETQLMGRVRQLMAAQKGRLEAAGAEVEVHYRRGPAPDGLLAELSEDAALAVFGTHGYGGFRQFFVGSVARKLVRNAGCPVLVIPPGASGEPIRSMLLPTDFSDFSRRAVEQALPLAEALGATVELYHCEIPHETALVPYGLTDIPLYDPSAMHAAAEERLGELSALARQRGLTTTTHVDVSRRPGPAIAARADEAGYDVIVMPSHGRSGFRRFIQGSVTEEVLRRSEHPLLVMHPVD